MAHEVYRAITNAVKTGRLRERFSKEDFRTECPGFRPGTYNTYLWKHRLGNGKTSELFVLIVPDRFRCIRPFRYGF